MAEAFDYPPLVHVLRDLPFETESVAEGRARAHLVVTPELCQPPAATGALLEGPLLTVIDVLAGVLAARVVAPDWVATASLSLHRSGRAGVGAEVVADAGVLRSGANTVVVDVVLSESSTGSALGQAVASFVRLPRRDGTPDISTMEPRYGERSGFALPGSGFTAAYETALGLDDVAGADPGTTRMELVDYVRNSFGALNGGVLASVAAGAGRRAAAGAGVAEPVVEDVVVHYLGAGRVGPVSTSATLERRATGALVRVEVRDDGADRLMAVAHVAVGSSP